MNRLDLINLIIFEDVFLVHLRRHSTLETDASIAHTVL